MSPRLLRRITGEESLACPASKRFSSRVLPPDLSLPKIGVAWSRHYLKEASSTRILWRAHRLFLVDHPPTSCTRYIASLAQTILGADRQLRLAVRVLWVKSERVRSPLGSLGYGSRKAALMVRLTASHLLSNTIDRCHFRNLQLSRNCKD